MNMRQTKIWKLFTSVKLAIWLLAITASVSVIGTVIPQNREPMEYIAKMGHNVASLLLKAGFTNVYGSWWFILILSLLSLNLFICLVNSFTLKIRTLGTKITHLSALVIFSGALIGSFYGVKGYVEIPEGKSISSFVSKGREVKLDFSVKLEDFIYEENVSPEEKLLVSDGSGKLLSEISPEFGHSFVIPGTACTIKALRYVPDFIMDMSTKKVISRSQNPRNPALEIEIKNGAEEPRSIWIFAAYPDIHGKIGNDLKIEYKWAARTPKDFISKLVILKDGKEAVRKDVRVNFPLKFEGYTFFQSSYDNDEFAWSGLQVVKDPGVPVVYLGFMLLIVGLVMKFYLSPITGRGK